MFNNNIFFLSNYYVIIKKKKKKIESIIHIIPFYKLNRIIPK